MSTALEERYRSLLRILPAAYRAEWEDEMVATFLATAASVDPEEAAYRAEFGRPGWSEVASVVGLAVRLRLPGAGRSGRPAFMGDAVRLVALIGLLAGAASGAVGTVAHLWLIGKLPGVVPSDAPAQPMLGVVPMTQVLLVATALPAYVLLVLGHRPAARALASVSAGAVVLVAVANLVAGHPFLPGRWVSLLLDLLVLAALWAHHEDAPPVPRRPWLLALPAAVAVAAVPLAAAALGATWWLADWPAMSCVIVAGALAVHLVRRGRPEWSLALAMLGGVVLVQRLVTLPDFVAGAAADERAVVLVAGLVEAATVAATALPVALWARRAWNRLPALR